MDNRHLKLICKSENNYSKHMHQAYVYIDLHHTYFASLGDILNLPFQDKSFDLVICSEVLEHIENYFKSQRKE